MSLSPNVFWIKFISAIWTLVCSWKSASSFPHNSVSTTVAAWNGLECVECSNDFFLINAVNVASSITRYT